jgi:AraC family transcriptional regulator of adaptative response/methylated-DNA-[protein]-cysteine methyltransferase
LKYDFPNARFTQVVDRVQQNVFQIFKRDWRDLDEIRLHVKGSEFQIKVWETLLKIPMGGLSTYGTIAKTINNPNASRAVGTAIGDNPIAYLIPCHRVIRSTGIIGEYRWGTTRKTAMIGWEAAKQNI